MCEPLDTLRIETLDVPDSNAVRPIIDAAFEADRAVTCCLQRKNAVSRAVFEKARELGFRVAWGNVLDDDAPAFYVWPADTWKTSTVTGWLNENGAHAIRAQDLRGI
jgi:hypothetical protein